MRKRIVLLQLVFFCMFCLNAQEKSNMRLGIEIGFLDLSRSETFGLLLNIEPKLQISDYSFVGLRVGINANSLAYENEDATQFIINELSGNGSISFVPTFDCYWRKLRFRPNLGIGVGPYLLVSYLDVFQVGATNPAQEIIEANVAPKIGLLFRGGFDLGKSRIGLEYNLVPKAAIELPDGQKAGTVGRSYLGLAIGFTIGSREE